LSLAISRFTQGHKALCRNRVGCGASGGFPAKNWRITFDVNADNEIENLDLEDYH
jgi:hypothetical protein